MWVNNNVVRRSTFLSPGQVVRRCFAMGKIGVRLAVGLVQRCFLLTQRAIDDRKR